MNATPAELGKPLKLSDLFLSIAIVQQDNGSGHF